MLLWEDEHIQAFTPITLGSMPVMLKEVLIGSLSNMTHCSNLWMSCRTHRWSLWLFPRLVQSIPETLITYMMSVWLLEWGARQEWHCFNYEQSFLRHNVLFKWTLLNETCDILSLEHSKELIHISTIAELLPEETQVNVNGWNMQTVSKAQ